MKTATVSNSASSHWSSGHGHLYKPHPINIFISLFLSAKLRAPECSPVQFLFSLLFRRDHWPPTTPSSTCLHIPLLDILSHSQILIFKIRVPELFPCWYFSSAAIFPICLTNVFPLELNTWLVTEHRLHTGPDQCYSKTPRTGWKDKQESKKTSPGGKRADPCKLKGLLPQLTYKGPTSSSH